jgi:uncharacterized protein involved in type VI secretion and phage assembly
MDIVPPFLQHQALAGGLGLHQALVTDLEDPEGQGRVRVRLSGVSEVPGQDGELWARVCTLFAGNNRGAFWMPDPGDEVLVGFLMGDLRAPIVLGGLWNGRSTSPETLNRDNNLKVVRSRNGNRIVLDDTSGQERVLIETPGGQRITLADGSPDSITIEDSSGNTVTMGAMGMATDVGLEVRVSCATVKVDAGYVEVNAPIVKCSAMLKCETLVASSVISASYTPGAGNIW